MVGRWIRACAWAWRSGDGIIAFEYSRWTTGITGHVSVLHASSGHSATGGEEEEEKEEVWCYDMDGARKSPLTCSW